MGNDLWEAVIAAHIRDHGVISCPTVHLVGTKHWRPISDAHKAALRDYEKALEEKRVGTIERNLRLAREHAETRVFPVIRPLIEKGVTDAVAWTTALNLAGIATPTGKEWTRKRLKNYLTSHPL